MIFNSFLTVEKKTFRFTYTQLTLIDLTVNRLNLIDLTLIQFYHFLK